MLFRQMVERYYKPRFHPDGDCECKRPLPSGRWYRGKRGAPAYEACDCCDHLMKHARHTEDEDDG